MIVFHKVNCNFFKCRYEFQEIYCYTRKAIGEHECVCVCIYIRKYIYIILIQNILTKSL